MDNINEMENIRNKCVNANSIDLQIHIVMFMRNCINELKNQNDWLASQAAEGETFTPQQRWWLDEITRHIGINISISVRDLNYFGFQARGGQLAAKNLFGDRLDFILEELNQKLG